MKTNPELRADARKALSGNWGPAVLVSLLASLPSLIAQAASASLNLPMENVFTKYFSLAYLGTSFTINDMINDFSASVSSGTWITFVVSAVCFVLLPFLNLGMVHYATKLVRKEEADVSDIFSRFSIFGKAIAEEFLRLLKVGLWGLLGIAVLIASEMLGLAAASSYIIGIGVVLGVGVYFFLVIRATLRYFLADFLLADHPEKGAMQVIRESTQLMDSRECLRLGGLLFSFIGWSLLITVVSSLVSQLSVFAGTLVSMALQLVLNMYLITSVAAYYLDRTTIGPEGEYAFAEEEKQV